MTERPCAARAGRRRRRWRTAAAGRRTRRRATSGGRDHRSSAVAASLGVAAAPRSLAEPRRARDQAAPRSAKSAAGNSGRPKTVASRSQSVSSGKFSSSAARRRQSAERARCVARADRRRPSQRVQPVVHGAATAGSADDRERSPSAAPLERAELGRGGPVVGRPPGGDLAQVAGELQPHQEVQRVDQVARERRRRCGRRATRPRSRSAVPSAAHAVLQRQRAHAMHDREDAELLQVDLGRRRGRAGRAGASTSRRARRTGRRRRRSGRRRRRCRRAAVEIARAPPRAGRRRRRPRAASRKIARFIGPSRVAAVDPVAQRVAEARRAAGARAGGSA